MKLSATKNRGNRGNGVAVASSKSAATCKGGTARPAPPSLSASGVSMAAAELQAARDIMNDLPDFDEARVVQLRLALKEGRIPFDPEKIAIAIQRFHGVTS